MKHLILGTAGHIDHGKTTLIERLTGKNTDRLSEEQERGISIDLGFSSLQLEEQDVELGIIDVPGHEKFVKNMLAGAGGIDLALLVVAGDEGVMPQTEEHLNILDFLGVDKGVVAVTKVDLVEDEEWLELVQADLQDRLVGTCLEGAPIITVSAVSGKGVEELVTALGKVAQELEPKDDSGNFYYPLDRSFTVDGFGTVVTGTLMSGSLEPGMEGVIYPQEEEVQIKKLNVHGTEVEEAVAGQRVGANLANIDVEQISRGDILATPGSLEPTTLLDTKLELLADAPLSLEHNDRLRLHLGAKEVFGRISILNQDIIYPGDEAYVQFRLEEPMVAYYDQPFVIRRYSPVITIGGGSILLPTAKKHQRFDEQVLAKLQLQEEGSDKERVAAMLEAKGDIVKPQELVVETGLTVDEVATNCQELVSNQQAVEFELSNSLAYLHSTTYQQLITELCDLLEQYHQQYPLRWGSSKEELRSQLSWQLDKQIYDQVLEKLAANSQIEIKEAQIKLAEHEVELTAYQQEVKDKLEQKFINQPFTPPTLDRLQDELEVEDKLIAEIFDLLVREGSLKRIDAEIYLHQEALSRAEDKLKDYLAAKEEITLAEYRDLLDSSRKYVLPLLEYFDQQGLTKRVGDQRVLL
ncbi:MAG: selenocysteine-specific translation elongation factor [Bacillota bacterium]